MVYRRRKKGRGLIKALIIGVILTFSIKAYKQGLFDEYITNDTVKNVLDNTVNVVDNKIDNTLENMGVNSSNSLIDNVTNIIGANTSNKGIHNNNSSYQNYKLNENVSFNKGQNFNNAKRNLVRIYAELSRKYNIKTLYCSCDIILYNNKLAIKSLRDCGYKIRHNKTRAERIEYEHVMPAHNFGHIRKCWVQGGRENCSKHDALFMAMEGDMHNLFPAIGEVNGDRSNYRMTYINSNRQDYGSCPMIIDSHNRMAMPPAPSRGMVARAYLYMEHRYGIKINQREKTIYQKWDQSYGVTPFECDRNKLISKIQGNDNPFITSKCNY